MQQKKYSATEYEDIKTESEVAWKMELKWRERGPPGKKGDTWRGQEFRESSGRYANRGGKAKDWYTAFYKAKAQGKDAVDNVEKENPKPWALEARKQHLP